MGSMVTSLENWKNNSKVLSSMYCYFDQKSLFSYIMNHNPIQALSQEWEIKKLTCKM